MSDRDPQPRDELHDVLQSVRRRLRGLTVAVIVMALMLAVTVVVVFGSLVNYFAGDALMYGSSAVGFALLGFAAGWIARRWA